MIKLTCLHFSKKYHLILQADIFPILNTSEIFRQSNTLLIWFCVTLNLVRNNKSHVSCMKFEISPLDPNSTMGVEQNSMLDTVIRRALEVYDRQTGVPYVLKASPFGMALILTCLYHSFQLEVLVYNYTRP